MRDLVLGLGLVLVIEGLVLALMPWRLEDLLRALGQIPPGARRAFGLAAVAMGVALVWLARRGWGGA